MAETDARTFVPIPARDAWAAIRGYVYQVETTILRWLHLQKNEELELECGEDIDIIQRTIFSPDSETNHVRTLEQVKHREKAITLRSPSAIEALNSFFEHLSNNPGIVLRFRFVTNAYAGKEQDTPIPEGRSAIEAWQLITHKSLPSETQAATLSAIRSLLTEAVPREKKLHAFLESADDSNLLNFIRSFEWSTTNPHAERLQQKIQDELLSMGIVSTAHESQPALDRLFVFTMRILSAPGRKVLTSAELTRQIAHKELSSADGRLLGLVNTLLNSLNSQLANIQQTTLQTQGLLEEVGAKIDSFIEGSTGVGGSQLPTIRVSTDVPPSVDLLVRRESSVSEVVAAFERATWYALQGEAGSGKTQFAILVAESCRPRQCLWIGLRNLTSWQCCSNVDLALAQATGIGIGRESRTWYEVVCGRLPTGTLIILDDLPKTTGNEELDVRLQLLAQACQTTGLRILSTASCGLPPQMAAILGSRLVDEKLPAFTDDEIAALVRLHGAPERLLNAKFIEFLGALTNRHPMLLTAAVRYLAGQQWKMNEQVIQSLFRREYGKDLKPFTTRLLMATVPDSRTREFLYRLNLAGHSFGNEDVEVICEVAPTIDLPIERMGDVLGLWVQKEGDSKYSLSPLLANLGSVDLQSSIRVGVHTALGASFFQKREVGPADVFDAFGHFHAAGELEKAASLLTLAFSNLMGDQRFSEDVWGLTEIWADKEIPREVSLSGRLILRGYQIGVRARLKKDVGFLLGDLDSLLESARPSDAMAVVGACAIITLRLFQADPSRVLKYAVRAIKNAATMVRPDGKPVILPQKGQLEFLLVAAGSAVKTETQIRDWLSALGQLNPEEIKRAFDIDSAEELCCTLCNGTWLRESSKEKPDWPGVFQQLGQIEDRASKLGIELLRVGAIRAKVIVLAEYQKRLDDAVSLAKETLEGVRGRPKAEFLINEIVGHQYLFGQKWDDALNHLDQAAKLEIRSFPFLRMRCLLAAGQAASHKDRNLAAGYCIRAVALAQSERRIPKLQVVVALAEKAIACWYSGDRESTFESCSEAARRLVECKSNKLKWKEVFGLFGHVLGYFCSISSTGKPPEADFEYAPPEQGWFLIDHPRIPELYDEMRDWGIAGQLAIFAEALGLHEDASKWAMRAVEMGRGSGNPPSAEGLLLYALADAVMKGQYGDALDFALTSTRALRVAWVHHHRGRDADLESSEREQSEYSASLIGLLPVVLQLAALWLGNPDAGRAGAKIVATKCQSIADSATRPDLWQSAAEIIGQSFNSDMKWKDLYEKGKSFSGKQDTSLQDICYLAASLHAPPAMALQLQLLVFPFLEKQLIHYGMYQRIVVPFVRQFWLRSVDVDSFHYTGPSFVKAHVEEVTDSLTVDSVKTLFQIIAAGLAISPKGDVLDWLRAAQIKSNEGQ